MEPQLNQEVIKTAAAHDGPIETDAVIVGAGPVGLVTALRLEKSVLIVPGDHFGMDGYLRIGFGDQVDYLRQGLERLHDLIDVRVS